MGLGALLRGSGNVADGMSLPAALNAIREGRMAPPPDGAMDGLISAPLPSRPIKPQRSVIDTEIEEWQREKAAMHREMREVLQRKANEAANAMVNNQPNAVQRARAIARAQRELNNE